MSQQQQLVQIKNEVIEGPSSTSLDIDDDEIDEENENGGIYVCASFKAKYT